MAERRMFTKKITDSDAFIELSSSAQALYFHLNQGADDDGFNNQIQNAMFKSHSTIDDLKVLMLKNFIIRFDSGVIVIKHWRMHNTLRKDRYTPTNFQEELKCLGIKDNGSYTLCDDGCHLVAKRLPQDSIDKCSIDKCSIDKCSIDNNHQKSSFLKEQDTYQDKCRTNCSNIKDKDRNINNLPSLSGNFDTEFDYLWKLYPNKQGKENAKQKYFKFRKSGIEYQDVLNGLNKYLKYIQLNKISIQYIKHGSTWFNQKCWEDEYETSNNEIQGKRDEQNELLKGVYNGSIKIN